MSGDQRADQVGVLVADLIQCERDLIELDARAVGITEETAGEYEIIYQDHGGVPVYLGIRRNQVFVWDRHSDWPTPVERAR